MTRTPGHAHPTGAPQAPAAAKPAPAKAGPATMMTPRNMAIGGGAAAALALVVALFVWKPWAPDPPRLNEPPAAIAKFAASSGMDDLPFPHQRQFMELLDEKDDAVLEAYEQGQLDDQQYRRVLQLAWYGEHLKKMDNYHSKPPSQRTAYLDKQADKKRKKKSDPKKNVESDPKSALKAEEIERDDSTEEQDVKQWPSDVRQKWTEYRTAWESRKQFHKDQRDREKAAQPAGAEAAASPDGGS